MQVTLARRRGELPAPGIHGQQQRAERKRGGLEAPALVGKVASLPHRCEGFPVAYCPHVVFSVTPGAGGDLRAQEVEDSVPHPAAPLDTHTRAFTRAAGSVHTQAQEPLPLGRESSPPAVYETTWVWLGFVIGPTSKVT